MFEHPEIANAKHVITNKITIFIMGLHWMLNVVLMKWIHYRGLFFAGTHLLFAADSFVNVNILLTFMRLSPHFLPPDPKNYGQL